MPPENGDPAPEFSSVDVLTGETHTLEQYEGKIVLLAFSGPSWCGPCQFEAPILEDLWQDFKGGNTQFLMISVGDTEQGFKNAVETLGITFPALTNPGQDISEAYGVNAVPTLVVIDAQQRVCAVDVGAGPPADEKYQEIHDLLVACGAIRGPLRQDIGKWMAVVRILFGGTNDGGGFGVTPGGKPVPIGPWDPLRQLSRDKRNLYASLAIAELADSLKDAGQARSIRTAALASAEASMRRLSRSAAAAPAFTKASEPAPKTGARTSRAAVPLARVATRAGNKTKRTAVPVRREA